jgi:Predicted membrane protein
MGMLFGFHGLEKLMSLIGHLFGGEEWGFVKFLSEQKGFPLPVVFAGAAALGESIAALMVAAGALTRYAAALVAATMLVAVHHHVTTDMRFELAAVYLVTAGIFLFTDPGKFSVDDWLRRRK